MNFKKLTLSLTGLVLSLLVFGGTAQAETTNITDNHASRVRGNINDYEGLFSRQYYRVNKKTTVKLAFYRKDNPSKITYRNLTIPTGTIISARSWTDPKNAKITRINDSFHMADLSYKLKQKVITSASANAYGNGEIYIKFRPGRNFTRVKRPSSVLPYGDSILAKGGVSAIRQLPTVTGDSVKLTSDGYIEYYKFNQQPYTSYSQRYFWSSKPTNYRKINHVLVKGSSVYLYYRSKLPNVNDKRVRKSGPYQYRLTIKNQHTPYSYEDTTQGDDTGFSSIYTIGGVQYNTRIAQGWN
ncbi:hypothetical protein GPK34_05870 [Secundilactobacillus kimchicus]|uniref:hypothetical protein n=1 Tax=Secundilactobacillus kimchicus TaxID=528209 RepID=UPI001C02FF6C|nr:hypothetical protein [Secundilactobacillus kimchicus]MBT9671552.1 hypothetical protein [Secundilactobacillus kimchicus]